MDLVVAVTATPSPVDQTLAALAHPVRRAILDRLRDGALTVGAIAAPYDLKKPTISRHLKVLEDARLIERTVEGRQHHCRLNPEGIRSLHGWLDRYERFWSGQLDELERFLDGAAERDPAEGAGP